jgi:glycosyltransferase involved in cell wall biosynthesis
MESRTDLTPAPPALPTTPEPERPLRVVIDARLASGTLGGVEQFIIGLADGLSQLNDGPEEFLFLTYAGRDAWLKPYIGGSCRIIHGTAATRQPAWTRALKLLPFVRPLARKLLSPVLARRAPARLPLPRSDGMVERAGVDLIHFPTQSAFLTEVPSIYHPWDLQHLHLPQYFTPEVVAAREHAYRAFCAQARMVCVATTWQRRDMIEQYGLPEEKVQVVAAAPVLSAYPSPSVEDLREAARKFGLPPSFIFYPAQTWAHKNHLGLLDALALLRQREGLRVPLVSSGKLNDFHPEIERRARELGLDDGVRFLGFVSPLELQCLYRLARAMIFPTFFEGFGLPVLEAFLAGVPVACSNVTSLPEQAGDAALIFDPRSPAEIADAVRRLWTDDQLCLSLVARGHERARLFTWHHTARLFRAHYRRLANRTLSPADQTLFSAPPII